MTVGRLLAGRPDDCRTGSNPFGNDPFPPESLSPVALLRYTDDPCTSICECMKLQKWYHDSVLLSNTRRNGMMKVLEISLSPQEEPVWLSREIRVEMKETRRAGVPRTAVPHPAGKRRIPAKPRVPCPRRPTRGRIPAMPRVPCPRRPTRGRIPARPGTAPRRQAESDPPECARKQGR